MTDYLGEHEHTLPTVCITFRLSELGKVDSTHFVWTRSKRCFNKLHVTFNVQMRTIRGNFCNLQAFTVNVALQPDLNIQHFDAAPASHEQVATWRVEVETSNHGCTGKYRVHIAGPAKTLESKACKGDSISKQAFDNCETLKTIDKRDM